MKIDGIGNSHTCNKNKNLYFVKYRLSFVVSFFQFYFKLRCLLCSLIIYVVCCSIAFFV